MARLFITDDEIEFFSHISKELIQDIIGQEITYYSINYENNVTNELYNESITKTVYSPVVFNALVMYNPPEQTTTNFSIDTIYNIEVYVHKHELDERNLLPREGDFCKFGKVMYEVKKITNPQITFGQIENEVMYKMECVVARESNFKIEP